MAIQVQTFSADILIVDDKLENIRFLSDFLSKHSYQVRKAINGQAALMAAKTLPPDLILLDINMPGMGGYEVCEILKNDVNTLSIPVIFLSAGNEVTDKLRAFQVGGIDYITKPFHLDEVLARIQTQLKIKQLQKELEFRNEQLQTTLLALQNTQAELVQKEKLVNASRIVAGISHEINNPLSFILGNIHPASEYSQKLISLVKLYQQALPDAPIEIKNFIDDIELDFMNTDFIKIIDSIHTGAERIRSVIHALNIFSRLDQSGIQPFNIKDSIDSVLMTLKSQMGAENGSVNITVVKEYTDIPEIMGYANLFNQALLNIFQNAIEALKFKLNLTTDGLFTPKIWIHLQTISNQQIKIMIKDNAIGISEENQTRIFEPFFTTKTVAQGVGLGLFTSYQIITGIYQGSLIYQNCLDGGSEFTIELPIFRDFYTKSI